MSQQLRGAVAWVTGGGRGIGRAIALAMADAGARVVVSARSQGEIDTVVAEIRRHRQEALAVSCDVTAASQVAELVERAEARLGAIDILVNNAGIAESAPVLKLEENAWNRTLAVNLTGTFLCTQAVLPSMVARARGRVINIASTAGRMGYRYSSAYCAAKHGVLGFTRSVALEMAQRGITVNAICPGWVDTDMTDASIARIAERTGQSRDEARKVLERMNPQGRLIVPEEVASVAVFLASDAAHGITGQAIDVDGGEVMA